MTNVAVKELGLGLKADWITPESPVFRPLQWPPERDWPVSIDRDGVVISRWGDPVWDFTPLAGTSLKLNFGDGLNCRTDRLDRANADLLRLCITWGMWGPKGIQVTGTLKSNFSTIRTVFALCSRNGILASELMRFPKVFEQLPALIAPSRFDRFIAELHRLHDARQALGFTIIDSDGLKRLAGADPGHETTQTPYIPPRIWLYQVGRLRECLDDFIRSREKIEACFQFCLDAYAENFGSLEHALVPGRVTNRGPFNSWSSMRPGCTYYGGFAKTADNFELTPLLLKWLGLVPKEEVPVAAFAWYLNLVQYAGLAYVANFTLQRKEEVGSLRASCLVWEEDEKLGRVPIICGETTKTVMDSDARWVASPSVECAIAAMTAIARMRMKCDRVHPVTAPTEADVEDPYLFSTSSEPWGSGRVMPYNVRPVIQGLGGVIKQYPCLFDPAQMTITEEDLKIAQQLTPNLSGTKFAPGKIWPLAWHQYRRTGAVNMFASGLISDSSMQHQMKHCTRLMPLYYGRGYSRLHLNREVETTVIAAMYEAMARQLQAVVSDQFVSPYSSEHKQTIVVNIVSAKDAKTLQSWAKLGKVSYREHRLGGCMKAGACEYGGIESVARCAGGDNGKPCSDVLYDKSKEPQVRADLIRLGAEMARLPENTPRYRALLSERRAMENYLNVIH